MLRGTFLVSVAAVGLLAAGAFAAEESAPAGQLSPQQLLAREVKAVSLAKEPLMRVLKQYGELSGLNVEADWDALENVGITKETPVSLQTRPMRFSKLLDLTLSAIAPKSYPLGWYLAGRDVTVSTQMRVLLRNQASLISFGGRSPESLPERRSSSSGTGVREYNFKETPLNMVIEFFRDLSGVNFHVNWRALEATGISKDTPVTLNVKDVSIARALDLVLDQLNVGRDRYSSLYWIIDEGVVQIAPGEAFNRTTQVRIYDIGDILMVVPNFVGPRIDLTNIGTNTGSNTSSNGAYGTGGGLFSNTGTYNNGTGSGSDTGEEENIAEQRQRIRDTLIEIIKLSIGDDMWAPTGKGSVRILRNQLIVSQTPLGFKLMEHAFRR